MKTEMKMPQMGESIAEATILKWLKSPGDSVAKDETILEISTDKVDSEIPAPASGILVEILANEGDTVEVKSVIAVIDSEASAGATESKAAAKEEAVTPPASPAPTAMPSTSQSSDRFYSPLVKSIASKHSISDAQLASINGTGTNNRVTKDDLMAFIEGGAPAASSPAPVAPQAVAAPAPSAPRPSTPAPSTSRAQQDFDSDGRKVVPMDSMRKLIAEHMVRSKATSPHVYSVAEVDVTNIAKWRKANQATFVAREGFKLSFTPFFLEATIRALMEFPQINASVEDTNIVYKRDINLGCAVALGKDGTDGLIVPNIKNADQLNLTGIARSLRDLAARARSKKLAPNEVQGGTFTVTNPGGFGSVYSFPIISQPQLGILSLGAIKKRPVVVNDAIAIRDIINITLAYDHRAIDGAAGGQFLAFITKYLQNWDMDRAV